MTPQGYCLGPTQVLDRLAGLSKVIPPNVMRQALLDSGRDK